MPVGHPGCYVRSQSRPRSKKPRSPQDVLVKNHPDEDIVTHTDADVIREPIFRGHLVELRLFHHSVPGQAESAARQHQQKSRCLVVVHSKPGSKWHLIHLRGKPPIAGLFGTIRIAYYISVETLIKYKKNECLAGI
jgi:hypothetical protein